MPSPPLSRCPDSNLRLVLTNKTWFPYRTFSPARWWRCLFGSAAVGSWRAVGDRTFAWGRCAPFALTPPSPSWGGVWCLFVRRLVLRLRIFVRTAVLGRKFRTEKDKKKWLTNGFGHLFLTINHIFTSIYTNKWDSLGWREFKKKSWDLNRFLSLGKFFLV